MPKTILTPSMQFKYAVMFWNHNVKEEETMCTATIFRMHYE